MNNKIILSTIIVIFVCFSIFIYKRGYFTHPDSPASPQGIVPSATQNTQNPLSISYMRSQSYPGSQLVIENNLTPTTTYTQYLASYQSDGLKIFGLLTIPKGLKPQNGWPVIIFNHGYLPPETYQTTQRYVTYVDAFAKNGYIVFKPDYRGHGKSEGQPEGAYYSPAYTIDALNAITSLKQFPDANPNKIGMWGHSMGGNITLRALVVNPADIKAAVIWGGVVGSYNDLMNNWQRRVRYQPPPHELALRNNYRQKLLETNGTPQENPAFWNLLDPTAFLNEVTTPIQLHTGGNDEEVPPAFSENLYQALDNIGKTVQFYSYPRADHNISSPSFSLAMQRSIDFFNLYLKGGENK